MVRYRYQERYATAGVVLSDLKQLEAKQSNKETIIISTRSSSAPEPHRHNAIATEVANNNHHQADRVIVAESTRLTNPPTSPQPAKKSKSRLMSIAAIIGVITLLIAGLVGWVFTKPKDEPETMQTLSNTEPGFSIDYPKAWSKQNRDDMFSRGAVFLSPLENDTDKFREKVSILVEDLSADMSLAEYTRSSVAQIKQLSDPNVAPAQTVNLGKETARRVVYNGLEDGNWVRRMQTWTVVGDRAYVITYTAQPESYDSYLPTVEKMIESFTRLD